MTKQLNDIAKVTCRAIATTCETRASYLLRPPPGVDDDHEEDEDEEDCELDRLQAQADALLRKRAKLVVFD